MPKTTSASAKADINYEAPPRASASRKSEKKAAIPAADRMSAGGLLTVREAADFLSACPRTVRNLIKKERLDAVRNGRRFVRVKSESVLAFSQRAGSPIPVNEKEG